LSAVSASAPTGSGALVCAEAPPATAARKRIVAATADRGAQRALDAATIFLSSRRSAAGVSDMSF